MKMKNFKVNLKMKAFYADKSTKKDLNTLSRTFDDITPINIVDENTVRLNAHDLFSLHTADIINEDVIFAR